MSYAPFGEPNVNTGVALRYTGQMLDPDSGLYYYKARWYSPYLGRFLSADPALLIDGLQTYKYVGNDPVNFVDPNGLAKQLARRWWPKAKPWLEWTPGIGDAIAIHDAWKDPSWTNTLAAAAGMIPGAGDAAGKLLKHGDEIGDLAKGFKGSKELQLQNPNYPIPRNSAGSVDGIDYSGHAFDQMQDRGIMPSVVKDTIQSNPAYATQKGASAHYDPVNNVGVVVNPSTGKVITVTYGQPK